MKKLIILGSLTIVLFGFSQLSRNEYDNAQLQVAVKKSIDLLQQSSHTFITNARCFSCHGQALGAVTFSMAKEKGFTLNDTLAEEASQRMLSACKTAYGRSMFLEHNELLGGNISTGYVLWGLAAAGCKPGKVTTIMVQQLMERQTAAGYWVGGNGRPPLECYATSATALAIKAIQHYAPAVLKDRVYQVKEKAKQWLLNTVPRTNEERVFQLLGLVWTDTDQQLIKQQATKLLTFQQPDGGWSQLDYLPTDVYATGQSLYALQQSHLLQVQDSAYQKGVSFLLRTQHEDGSWEVKSRTMPSIPYVASGFPYGGNQFISAAGSSWATMALLLAAK